ncbi:FAD-linked oxidoreductase [Saccharata proteae CBS 121410]|uniref:Proline dehydrogenase n=1 Tax=Saccharata proteae CBS 121410 TaxID=1314787 RepID=A0A9P4HZ88_9PEZI|nr:FAD-linked oxidoreductase [Saccharata proteae CBS 121410]
MRHPICPTLIPLRRVRPFQLRHVSRPYTTESGTRNGFSWTRKSSEPALSCLPLTNVIRTYLITSISSSPTLWRLTFALLKRMANSSSFLADPDKNLPLRWILKKTFYAQFCAGENKEEARLTAQLIRDIGYHGVIIESALEVTGDLGVTTAPATETTEKEIETWRNNMLATVRMVQDGEFVALKWSGLGQFALMLLNANRPPSEAMKAAIHEVCDVAAAKDVAILPGAEEEATNAGIDTWTLDLMRKYNSGHSGRTIMYNTYQAYLKSTPARLARHLAAAKLEGYTLGIKLVRGAYLESESKSLLLPSKEDTDRVYNALAKSLLQGEYDEILQPVYGSDSDAFPSIALVLATHNMESVQRAQKIRNDQAALGLHRIEFAYAQLQGMADEVGCEIIQMGRSAKTTQNEGEQGPLWRKTDVPRAFKCLPWGSTSECLQYLMRRASENRDAATRTEGTRRAMGSELIRRAKRAVLIA